MELGLALVFDGKLNEVFHAGGVKEYPIGGMLCEYARVKAQTLKPLIMKNSYYNETDWEKLVPSAIDELRQAMAVEYGVVATEIITAEFMEWMSDYRDGNGDEREKNVTETTKMCGTTITEFILEDTGFDSFGAETVGHILLSAYASWSVSFVYFRHSFNIAVSDGENALEQQDAMLNLYDGENVDIQNIGFKVILYDGKFHSLYTIKSSISLFLFELAHILNADMNLVRCKNCGEYFVPVGRSDAVYCGYPAPQEQEKTCREIGARNTRARKMKNDTATREYRRLYMRLKMAIQRHPEDEKLKQNYTMLTEKVKEMRKKVKAGAGTSDDIIEWLQAFENSLSDK